MPAPAPAALEPYEHADPRFTIDLPAGSEVGAMPGTLVVARAPEGWSASPFRPNLTVVAQDLGPDGDLPGHADASLVELARSLPRWRLIDREARDGTLRTLGMYRARIDGVDLGREVPVTVEQWRTFSAGLLWIVSGSAETGDHAAVCELWQACAESLAPA